MKKSVIHSVLATVAMMATAAASAQTIYLDPNFKPRVRELNGLYSPQDKSELPTTKTPPAATVRKPNVPQNSTLKELGNKEYSITGGWEMLDADNAVATGDFVNGKHNSSQWYSATVPGTVLTTLVDQGVYPDPYYGLNNMFIPDTLCRMDWWYVTKFTAPRFAEGERVLLDMQGINYKASIFVGGKHVGSMVGAFKRGLFDITDQLTSGAQSVIAVRILPPNNPGIPHEQSSTTGFGPNGGFLCMDGPTFISSEGWDWIPGIRDRNMGIWQDVRLKVVRSATLADPQIITDVNTQTLASATLTIRTDIVNSAAAQKATLEGEYEGGKFSKSIDLKKGVNSNIILTPADFAALEVKNPRLWWPSGYGEPNLYTMKLTLKDSQGNVSDTKEIRFGIRKVTYELSLDTPSKKERRIEYDPITVAKQGKKVIDNSYRREVESGTFVPRLMEGIDESVLTDAPDDKMGAYLIIKVNGVRIFCKGGNWGMDDGMKRVSRERLEPAIKLHKYAGYNMIRNWTGETTEEDLYALCDEYGMMVWNDFWLSTEFVNRPPIDENLTLDNARDVVRRFRNHPSIVLWCPRNEGYAPAVLDEGFSKISIEDDGTRLYIGNSRNLNLKPSGMWVHLDSRKDYFTKRGHGFNTEIGAPSIPTAETMRKFIPESDLWPQSDNWFYHDWVPSAKGPFANHLKDWYGEATDVDDYCKKAQMLCYDDYRAIMEGYNSNMWDNASGALYWMTHPAWPSMVWQTYTYDFETHGAYFGSAKGCEPIHIQCNEHDNKVVGINTTRDAIADVTASAFCYDMSGKSLWKKSVKGTLAANGKTEFFTAEASQQSSFLLRVVLTDKKGEVLSVNDYWRLGSSQKNFKMLGDGRSEVKYAVRPLKPAGEYEVTVSNSSKRIAVAIKLNAVSKATGQTMLPAYFSDGYFNLLPGEKRKIYFKVPFTQDVMDVKVSGYNL